MSQEDIEALSEVVSREDRPKLSSLADGVRIG